MRRTFFSIFFILGRKKRDCGNPITYIRLSCDTEVLLAIMMDGNRHPGELIVDLSLDGESRHSTYKIPGLVENGTLFQLI